MKDTNVDNSNQDEKTFTIFIRYMSYSSQN